MSLPMVFCRKCSVMADRVVLHNHCRCKCVQWFQSGGRGLVIGAVWGGGYDDGEGSGWGGLMSLWGCGCLVVWRS